MFRGVGLFGALLLIINGMAVAQTAAPASADPGSSNVVPAPADNRINPIEDPRDRIFYPGDTERPGPLVHKLLANFVLDQKQIWTSPFRMNRDNAKWWLLFGGTTGALIASDHYLENRIEHSRFQRNIGNNISYVGDLYTLVPAAAGLYVYGVWKDDPKPREVGVLSAQALMDSLVVMEVMKVSFGRNRPNVSNPSERGEWFDNGQSFPSGHSMMSWTLASVLEH